jgi:hypothetical protein
MVVQFYRPRAGRSFRNRGRHVKVHAGLFPGAACCHPIELRHYKAAPLQALGMGRPVFIRRTKCLTNARN